MSENAEMNDNPHIDIFTFGDAEPVLDSSDYMSMFRSYWNGEFYEPPFAMEKLAKLRNANAHHGSAIDVKAKILTSCYEPGAKKWLSKRDFLQMARDFLIFGDSYCERVKNGLGGTLTLRHSPAKYTRRGKDGDFFFLNETGQRHKFRKESVFQISEGDINQEIYGVPTWLPAMQSILLNEGATLFRRKYFVNGAHAGFLIYITDPNIKGEEAELLKSQLRKAKGMGNFKNMVVTAPNGNPDGIKLMPIAEVSAKDDFLNIKDVSRDDILAVHRVPPQIMGIIPKNTSGFGSHKDAALIFNRNEIVPLQDFFLSINDWLGEQVVTFKPYVIEGLGEKGSEK
ncbi:phage portal protein [Kiloniella sp. b19]|uniref:phage portal protein n=1 Tax=Kiloniella sp. GXU_MW_B19 TaxID=3141326 RepID=UPI0031DD93E6